MFPLTGRGSASLRASQSRLKRHSERRQRRQRGSENLVSAFMPKYLLPFLRLMHLEIAATACPGPVFTRHHLDSSRKPRTSPEIHPADQGAGVRPRTCSIARPIESSRRSLPRGPSTSTPTGIPEGPSPPGIDKPGIPALLPGSVLRMKSRKVSRALASGPGTGGARTSIRSVSRTQWSLDPHGSPRRGSQCSEQRGRPWGTLEPHARRGFGHQMATTAGFTRRFEVVAMRAALAISRRAASSGPRSVADRMRDLAAGV